jgi:steroid delta-isomerase-like uncharacterized protein
VSEQNKQIARRFTAAFAANDAAAYEEVVADEVVDHNPRPGQKPGRQAVIDAVAAFAAGFPDLELTVEQEVAEGDLMVQYGMLAGTNTGQLMGMPATDKPVRLAWMDMHRIKGGQIVESWHLEDTAGMLQQLGVTPG